MPLAPLGKGDRIVSLDMCADQMLTGLVAPDRIAALSNEADIDDEIRRSMPLVAIARVRADAERVIALRPTLVVRSYSGGPRFDRAMAEAGIPVFTLPYADTIAATRQSIVTAGQRLNAREEARKRLAALDEDLRGAPQGAVRTALYLTPGNVTTGKGSLIAEMMERSGFITYEPRAGWHSLPLERIARNRPDAVIRGFFDRTEFRQDRWSTSNHALVKARLDDVPTIHIDGSNLACPNWRIGKTVRLMRQLRTEIGR